MSVNTVNAYGRITVTEEAIAEVAGSSARECYGIVDLVPKKLSDNIADLLRKKKSSRGVRVLTNGDRIFIDLYVVMKYGVSIDAVAQTLKNTVRYDVEKFTGMFVDTVNVNVIGIRV
ncbi:MAG: Asp23/Gls24 family envelope stress response protein [Clostridia bacterium]|nr:Asp23/Gls24 family envelope stress response protein [Clostridia bacterium]